MSHRYNSLTLRKEPKPSASDRTWSRWRVRKNIENKEDKKRIDELTKVKTSIKESFMNKFKRKKD